MAIPEDSYIDREMRKDLLKNILATVKNKKLLMVNGEFDILLSSGREDYIIRRST